MKYLILIALSLITPSIALGVTLTAMWQLNDPSEQIENYILYEHTKDGSIEIARVDGQTNTTDFEHTGGSKTYLLTAERDGVESFPAVARYSLATPGEPVTFTITVQGQ